MFETISYRDSKVIMIDQRKLPNQVIYNQYTTHLQVAEAIKEMVIRGAPAIGCATALGIALGARQIKADDYDDFKRQLDKVCDELNVRPTAVNLRWAIEAIQSHVAHNKDKSIAELKESIEALAIKMLNDDIETNKAMGMHGAELLPSPGCVLTHCNAGALATAGYGTALGVIYAAREMGKDIKVLADETRPFLQGARLTAWELMENGVDVTVICDNMAGWMMKQGKVDAVIVGADRIAANGDVANKIGTMSLAILAKNFGIPFYVVAPLSTIDTKTASGADIPIEQRTTFEVSHINGKLIVPEGAKLLNPAFDVTPNSLVTAIVTEKGVLNPPYSETIPGAFETD